MLLSELARMCSSEVVDVRGDCEIDDLAMDTRKPMRKALFFCISGARYDSHRFADQAVKNGAVCLAVEKWLDAVPVPQILVTNGRKAMTAMSQAFFGYPARGMKILGVTGTKGKTTTSYLMKAIMEKAGYKSLRQMADEGVTCVSMEVSAHALNMGRLEGLHFEAGCYTNLSQDHLDLFGTMENYFQCKKTFFDAKWISAASVNADDEKGAEIIRSLNVPRMTYGIAQNADLYARDIEITEYGVGFTMGFSRMWEYPVRLQLTGTFNVYNALAAASVGMIMGVRPEIITEALESVRAVPGRAEMLETGTPYKVILDYSHSPDALENILKTVREFARGRVICVFGCGGDRDKLKRPLMGEISGRLADLSILTSDNPRSEDPYEILGAIEEGVRRTDGEYKIIENRKDAIRYAMEHAADGDMIILAGKGHETYQEIRGVKRPFNEKTVVQRLLKEIAAGHQDQ